MVNNKLKPSVNLDLFIEEKKWHLLPLINHETLINIISTIIYELKLDAQIRICELSVFLVNDSKIKKHNKKYRDKDSPTNTLSFPSENLEPGKKINTVSGYIYAGDTFFSLETIQKESKEQGKNIYDHFYHLLLHSFLHLLGYHHDNIEDQERMENIEKAILFKLGIPNPYE